MRRVQLFVEAINATKGNYSGAYLFWPNIDPCWLIPGWCFVVMYSYLVNFGDFMQMLDGSQTLLSNEELKKKFDQEGKKYEKNWIYYSPKFQFSFPFLDDIWAELDLVRSLVSI